MSTAMLVLYCYTGKATFETYKEGNSILYKSGQQCKLSIVSKEPILNEDVQNLAIIYGFSQNN